MAAIRVTSTDARRSVFAAKRPPKPLLYQVATGILSTGEIAPVTRDVLRRQQNLTVELGEVTAIDATRRELTVSAPELEERAVGYDSLILAGGMQTWYFGHAGFEQFASGMKTLDDALTLRAEIFGAFERAELEEDPQERQAWLTFAIVGGGPTGVELAGQIGELARRSLTGNFRRVDPASARIVLFDAGTRIWAAGVRAAPLAALLAQATGAPTDRLGRVSVERDLSVPGHPEIFVVGDMMDLDGLPGQAEVAMQTGRHAARVVAARAAGHSDPRPFAYHDLGTMAAVSRTAAVAEVGPLRLSGRLGWLAWLVVHIVFLTGFKNRFTTLVHWGITFLGNARSERAY